MGKPQIQWISLNHSVYVYRCARAATDITVNDKYLPYGWRNTILCLVFASIPETGNNCHRNADANCLFIRIKKKWQNYVFYIETTNSRYFQVVSVSIHKSTSTDIDYVMMSTCSLYYLGFVINSLNKRKNVIENLHVNDLLFLYLYFFFVCSLCNIKSYYIGMAQQILLGK